jgi:hypothetical protein
MAEALYGKLLADDEAYPLFTLHEWPEGAQGVAGVWLPLLSLFNGARQAELADLKVSNVRKTRRPDIR